MTHYYYFIMAGSCWDESTQLFRVGVGTSRQGTRDFLFLTAFAASHNYYFEKDSVQSSEFFMKCLKSFASSADPCGNATTRSLHVSARELVRALKKSERIPVPENVSRNVKHQLHFLSLNYRVISNLNRAASLLPSKETL